MMMDRIPPISRTIIHKSSDERGCFTIVLDHHFRKGVNCNGFQSRDGVILGMGTTIFIALEDLSALQEALEAVEGREDEGLDGEDLHENFPISRTIIHKSSDERGCFTIVLDHHFGIRVDLNAFQIVDGLMPGMEATISVVIEDLPALQEALEAVDVREDEGLDGEDLDKEHTIQ